MQIKVTFTNTEGKLPEGASVICEDVSGYELRLPRDMPEITCEQACCSGCDSVHREFSGNSHLNLNATSRAARWEIPEAVN